VRLERVVGIGKLGQCVGHENPSLTLMAEFDIT
jgi:hypothetical protein